MRHVALRSLRSVILLSLRRFALHLLRCCVLLQSHRLAFDASCYITFAVLPLVVSRGIPQIAITFP